jgi:hypothetical protein
MRGTRVPVLTGQLVCLSFHATLSQRDSPTGRVDKPPLPTLPAVATGVSRVPRAASAGYGRPGDCSPTTYARMARSFVRARCDSSNGRERIMKFIGGYRHGTDVPRWARDGRSFITIDAPRSQGADPEQYEYRLAVWRHGDGTTEFFFCARALHTDAEIDAAARPLLSRARHTGLTRWATS